MITKKFRQNLTHIELSGYNIDKIKLSGGKVNVK